MRFALLVAGLAVFLTGCATARSDARTTDEPRQYFTGSNIKQREANTGTATTCAVSGEALKRTGLPEMVPAQEGYRGTGG
jgi:uncharacterized protein YceK